MADKEVIKIDGGTKTALYAILIVVVVILVVLVFCCFKKNGEVSQKQCRWIAVEYLQNSDECVVTPDELTVNGDTKVTFINLTDENVTIGFISSNAILGGTTPFTIAKNDSHTVELKQPGVLATYEYKVDATCYTMPVPGPRVIIP